MSDTIHEQKEESVQEVLDVSTATTTAVVPTVPTIPTVPHVTTLTSDFKSPFCKLTATGASPISSMRWCICIDNSGSTSDSLDTKSVLETEIDFAKGVISSIDPEYKSVSVIRWDNNAEKIDYTAIDSLKPSGGTSPAIIFSVPECQKTISQADCLMIMTDGAIGQNEVTSFGHAMMTSGRHFKAVIGVLVGRNHARISTNLSSLSLQQRPGKPPSDINVSVLVPAMVSNACILYHDSTNTYIMWASGTFKQDWAVNDIEPTTEWDEVTKMNLKSSLAQDHQCLTEVNIPTYDVDSESRLITHGYVPLGNGLYFHPENLLVSTPNFDEIVEYPFSQVCQYFKVNDKYTELVEWFKGRLLDAFSLQEDDKDNFTALIEQMTEMPQVVRRDPSNPFMSVYISARNRHIARRYIATDEDIENQITDPRAVRVLQFFRDMIRVMDEDIQMIQEDPSASYAMSSISTSRYTSGASASASASARASGAQQGTLSQGTRSKRGLSSTVTAKFNEPHLWYSQVKRLHPGIDAKVSKHDCSICFENKTPFLLVRANIELKELEKQDSEELYKHFYPTLMCSRCADFFCQKGIDPVRQTCIAAIPIISISLLSSENLIAYANEFSKLIDDSSSITSDTSSNALSNSSSAPSHSRNSSRGVGLSSRRETMLNTFSTVFNAVASFSSAVSESIVGGASSTTINSKIAPKCMITVANHVKQFVTDTEEVVLAGYISDIKNKFNMKG